MARVLKLRRYAWEAALIGVTVIWGSTFVVVKEAVDQIPVYTFNALRFTLAAVALGAFCLPGLRRLGRDGWRHGSVLGVFLFAGYAFQTVGLRHTDASRAGFITGMFVVFTPMLAALILRRMPQPSALLGVAFATVGLGLLSLRGSLLPGFGDLLVLGCALAFAAHIVGLGAWSRRHAALPLTVAQLGTAALLHGAVALATEGGGLQAAQWDRGALAAILLTALGASAGAFWIQTAAQRIIPPTRTAIILTMEPVFAGLFGYVLLAERLSGRGWLGAGLILLGMLTAELGAAGEAEHVEPPAPALRQPTGVP
jgi:drug/metabolite transporter (DMT)-like permease